MFGLGLSMVRLALVLGLRVMVWLGLVLGLRVMVWLGLVLC